MAGWMASCDHGVGHEGGWVGTHKATERRCGPGEEGSCGRRLEGASLNTRYAGPGSE